MNQRIEKEAENGNRATRVVVIVVAGVIGSLIVHIVASLLLSPGSPFVVGASAVHDREITAEGGALRGAGREPPEP